MKLILPNASRRPKVGAHHHDLTTRRGDAVSRAASFKQADVQRAIKAARAAGLEVGGFTVDPRSGAITVLTAKQAEEQVAASPLEEWRRRRGQSAA